MWVYFGTITNDIWSVSYIWCQLKRTSMCWRYGQPNTSSLCFTGRKQLITYKNNFEESLILLRTGSNFFRQLQSSIDLHCCSIYLLCWFNRLHNQINFKLPTHFTPVFNFICIFYRLVFYVLGWNFSWNSVTKTQFRHLVNLLFGYF